jgi:spore coat polysaccharide biosynthesis protein SpsF
MSWDGFTGDLLAGWDWIPLRPEFCQKLPTPSNKTPQIVITMGGSDPAGLSLLALKALERLDFPLAVRLITGRSFSHGQQLANLFQNLHIPVSILEDVKDMPGAVVDADLVIASFGVTAYELAALGVPMVLLSITDDHARSASALQQAGMALSLGHYSAITETTFADSIRKLANDVSLLNRMRVAGNLIDGKGADRIAGKINEALSKQHQIVKEQ